MCITPQGRKTGKNESGKQSRRRQNRQSVGKKCTMISQTLSTQLVFMIRKDFKNPISKAIFMYSNEHPRIIVSQRKEMSFSLHNLSLTHFHVVPFKYTFFLSSFSSCSFNSRLLITSSHRIFLLSFANVAQVGSIEGKTETEMFMIQEIHYPFFLCT
jgi:hypothetical protein